MLAWRPIAVNRNRPFPALRHLSGPLVGAYHARRGQRVWLIVNLVLPVHALLGRKAQSLHRTSAVLELRGLVSRHEQWNLLCCIDDLTILLLKLRLVQVMAHVYRIQILRALWKVTRPPTTTGLLQRPRLLQRQRLR